MLGVWLEFTLNRNDNVSDSSYVIMFLSSQKCQFLSTFHEFLDDLIWKIELNRHLSFVAVFQMQLVHSVGFSHTV